MSYFDLSEYLEDFSFVKEMKTLLIEELCKTETVTSSDFKTGIFTELEDGRQVRIVLPHGMAPLKPYLTENTRKTDSLPEEGQDNGQVCKGQQLGFVAFVGYKALSVPEKVEKEIWSVDTQLVQELGNMDGLFAYICGERVKGGDYSNLVLFQNRESLQDLFQSPNHEQAKSSLSPRFYTHVRIHSGSLQDGLTSPYFTLEKTIFLFFTLPADDPGRRRVQLWRARRDEFDDVKVLRH